MEVERELVLIPDTTLTIIDCVDARRAFFAINYSLRKFSFPEVKFLTSLDIEGPHVRHIDHINSREAYSEFCYKKLNSHINTKYCLLIQWDGFIVGDENSWADEFLKYDYIGAPWEYNTHCVGNGGFSLRSKRLLSILERVEVPRYHPEDETICRLYRIELERMGIAFAPEPIARKFSFEKYNVKYTTYEGQFGFHDIRSFDIERLRNENSNLNIPSIVKSSRDVYVDLSDHKIGDKVGMAYCLDYYKQKEDCNIFVYDPYEKSKTSFPFVDFFPQLKAKRVTKQNIEKAFFGNLWIRCPSILQDTGFTTTMSLPGTKDEYKYDIGIHTLKNVAYNFNRNHDLKSMRELIDYAKTRGLKVYEVPDMNTMSATSIMKELYRCRTFIGGDSGFSHCYATLRPDNPLLAIYGNSDHDISAFEPDKIAMNCSHSWASDPLTKNLTKLVMNDHVFDMEVAKYWIDSIEKSDTLVDETIKLNIGCNKNLLPGWINIDMIDYPGVIKHDLRERLPYANNTIEFVVSEHLIEHLTREEALRLLRDIYRCLQSGGVCRTSTPDLDILVKNYIDNNIHAYDNVGFTPRNRCEMMNIGMRGWEHKYLYNKEDLKLLFEEAGFTEFRFVLYRDSRYLELKNIEQREYTNEIICEAIK